MRIRDSGVLCCVNTGYWFESPANLFREHQLCFVYPFKRPSNCATSVIWYCRILVKHTLNTLKCRFVTVNAYPGHCVTFFPGDTYVNTKIITRNVFAAYSFRADLHNDPILTHISEKHVLENARQRFTICGQKASTLSPLNRNLITDDIMNELYSVIWDNFFVIYIAQFIPRT